MIYTVKEKESIMKKRTICLILAVVMSSFALLNLTSCSNDSVVRDAIQDTFFSSGVNYTISYGCDVDYFDEDTANRVDTIELNVNCQYQSSDHILTEITPSRGISKDEIYYSHSMRDSSIEEYYSAKDQSVIDLDSTSKPFPIAIHLVLNHYFIRYTGLMSDTLEGAIVEENEDGTIVILKDYPHNGKIFSDSALTLLGAFLGNYEPVGYPFSGPNQVELRDLDFATFKMVIKDGLVQSIECAYTLSNATAVGHFSFNVVVNEVSPSITVTLPDGYKS